VAGCDPARHIVALHVAEDCLEHPYAREIIRRSRLPFSVLKGDRPPDITGSYPANLSTGKKHLFLCRQRGKFFKPCPGTREYQCCGYHVLNIGMNCPMDCVYCILQAYLNNPWLSFFVNVEDLFAELDRELGAHPEKLYRIGTGEFTDSLALDSLTALAPRLVEYMGRSVNGLLELKTKSVSVANLAGLPHNGRTVVAWSLNSPAIVQREELRTAGLEERLAAAGRCADWGYLLAFHFDPIIWHPCWEQGYRHTIRRLFASVPRERIVWISLGGLRYLPALKTIAGDRFPVSRFFYEEFVEGLDGKSRYFRPQRLEMYRLLVDELRKYAAETTCLYFCMESEAIWREVFGFAPVDRGGLAAMLDRAVPSQRK